MPKFYSNFYLRGTEEPEHDKLPVIPLDMALPITLYVTLLLPSLSCLQDSCQRTRGQQTQAELGAPARGVGLGGTGGAGEPRGRCQCRQAAGRHLNERETDARCDVEGLCDFRGERAWLVKIFMSW